VEDVEDVEGVVHMAIFSVAILSLPLSLFFFMNRVRGFHTLHWLSPVEEISKARQSAIDFLLPFVFCKPEGWCVSIVARDRFPRLR
jgi:hypothetical protein